MARSTDLTKGNITRGLWGFALPLMLGNVLQQLYNLVDTWVVGRYVGDNALAAVGSSYTLMTFLTSVIIGLCLGSSSFVSVGNADAISGAKPATSFPIPSITMPMRGRRLSATVPMLSMKLLNSKSKFCVSSAMPTIRFAHAAFMLATLP
jgi:hypothetical protein